MAACGRVARGAYASSLLTDIDRKERGAHDSRSHYVAAMPKQTTSPSKTAQRRDALKDDARYNAFAARDSRQAGRFVMAVATTGIYCRPGCPARLPKRENVTFYDTPAQAETAGFRACKRCQPRVPLGETAQHRVIADACRQIETADEPPKLEELAAAAGLSSYHFHRLFKAATGVTPKAYAVAHRRRRVRDNLKEGTVTDAIYRSGFASNGRFYADSAAALGMSPSQFKSGAADLTIRFAVAPCTLGLVLVAATETGVCAIYLGDTEADLVRELKAAFAKAHFVAADAALTALTERAVRLVDDPAHPIELPLDIRGTAFQHRVWQALRDIPAGETRTYAQIAQAIGSPKAVRAVGTACGANNISVAIPCHRVVRSDGTFPNANYRWGASRKKSLLDREARTRKR